MSGPPPYEPDHKGEPGYPHGPQPGYPQPGPPPAGFQQPGYQPPGYPQPGYQQPGHPQHGYPPAGQPGSPPQQGTTVVVGVPAITVMSGFHEGPMNITCPQCRASVVTRTSYETGTLTWIICGVLCLFGCWFGCCLIPFCVDGCKDVRHTCPNCNASVGVYRRM